ncbi:hypothetical protein RJ639_040176, partial [Escallonia herrerae]
MYPACLEFGNPIQDAVSRVRFAPKSNNLLIASWDSSLRLYDVSSSRLRLEAPTEAALLDCCFQNEAVALSAGHDGSINRYDLHSGIIHTIGNHEDSASCIEYSDETCVGHQHLFISLIALGQTITGGWDKMILSWDTRSAKACGCLNSLRAEVESMSISGFSLMVAVGSSVNMYDLRNSSKSVQAKESCMDIRIKCVRPALTLEGFVVGSVDGRVALKYVYPSKLNTEGYVFRCHPKAKSGRRYLTAVNDIAFNASICGAFVTGDNEGFVTAWDARSKKRLLEFPRYPNSVSSLSFNHEGQLLAVAASYTYHEANERP